ncbi:hypothetical protein VMCG_09015 [Cytospora schulzeri]|uniref:Protein kinase domain-containing protein n=1 Tax=Cytospora schulzeri TaxID=448051 RepID=A0A423VPL0_9PEZI|nr:hypothetical protein VMCG_09015 [Valsa malicola]
MTLGSTLMSLGYSDDIWRARQLGKNGWYLPEQFTAEWDYVNYEPYSEGVTDIGAGTGTAGFFSERSNIWAIGLVMRCCITRSQPDRPPYATPVPPKGPQMGTQGYTYGGELRKQFFGGIFGRDLCRLVSQCLMHRPLERPSLARLRQDIAAGVAANPLSPDDKRWVRTTLFGAGNPVPQYPIDPTQAAGKKVTVQF